MRKLVKGLAGGAALLTALAYSPPARRWYLRHGATSEEVSRTMPGDELLAEADLVSTRSITIDAPPTGVWPWLVQPQPDQSAGSFTRAPDNLPCRDGAGQPRDGTQDAGRNPGAGRVLRRGA